MNWLYQIECIAQAFKKNIVLILYHPTPIVSRAYPNNLIENEIHMAVLEQLW